MAPPGPNAPPCALNPTPRPPPTGLADGLLVALAHLGVEDGEGRARLAAYDGGFASHPVIGTPLPPLTGWARSEAEAADAAAAVAAAAVQAQQSPVAAYSTSAAVAAVLGGGGGAQPAHAPQVPPPCAWHHPPPPHLAALHMAALRGSSVGAAVMRGGAFVLPVPPDGMPPPPAAPPASAAPTCRTDPSKGPGATYKPPHLRGGGRGAFGPCAPPAPARVPLGDLVEPRYSADWGHAGRAPAMAPPLDQPLEQARG